MNPISILFFALSSFLGVDESRIVSRKATVNIDPVHQTFEIVQEDLFSIILTKEDSMAMTNELQLIMDFAKNLEGNDSSGFILESLSLQGQENQLNATLKGRYTDIKAFEEAGIDLDSTGFSLINIPEWNIRSEDAVLKENYWIWPANKKVTLVIEAFEDIPEEYSKYRRSILPYWDSAQAKGKR